MTGRTIGQMPFDLSAVHEWQFEIHIGRKQFEDILATLRMVFHVEEPGPTGNSYTATAAAGVLTTVSIAGEWIRVLWIRHALTARRTPA